jgi:hypothetical protein
VRETLFTGRRLSNAISVVASPNNRRTETMGEGLEAPASCKLGCDQTSLSSSTKSAKAWPGSTWGPTTSLNFLPNWVSFDSVKVGAVCRELVGFEDEVNGPQGHTRRLRENSTHPVAMRRLER